MSFGTNLKSIMREKDKTASDLAEYLGVSRGLVTHWTNDVRNPKPEYVQKIIDFLNIDSSILFDDKTIPVAKIPIVGTASCGASDINYLQASNKGIALYNGDFYTPRLYCVIANGDSMMTDIDDGDEVICDPDAKILSGDIVHYRIGDESAIKVFVDDTDANIIQLVPFNSNEGFKTTTIRKDDDMFSDIVMAKVVAVNKLKYNNRLARLRLIGRA